MIEPTEEMMAKRIQTLDERAEAAERANARARAKLANISKLPSEPVHLEGSDTPVVWFLKMWGGTRGEVYQYVANHVPGKGWVISHQRRNEYMTWNEVLVFALLREDDDWNPEFHLATSWEKMRAI